MPVRNSPQCQSCTPTGSATTATSSPPGSGPRTMRGAASAAETAGLAALLVASGKSNVAASNQIRGTTDPVAQRTFGRINVLKALTMIVAPSPPPPGPTPTPAPAGSPPTYVVAVNNTKTTVTCNPSNVVQGTSTTCTASVQDTSSSPTPPTGTVSWTHTNTGSFDFSTCTLTTVSTDTASCSVMYTPGAAGDHKITGDYSPDAAHKTSKDTFTVT